MSRFNLVWILSLSLGLWLVLVTRVQSQKVKCDEKSKKDLDNTMALVMTFGTERKYPINKIEFKEYCKEHQKLLAKVENYKNACLKGQAKSLVSIISYSIKQVVGNYCKNLNSKKTEDLLKSTGCGNKASKKYLECSDDYSRHLIHAGSLKDSKERLAITCCSYFEIFKCVRSKAKEIGGSECTEENIETNIDFIKSYFENSLNALCGDYTDSGDKCEKLKLGAPKPVKNLPKSFINPFVEVLVNL